MLAVKMSLIVLTIILFSITFVGCFGCEPQVKKCVTPNVAKPVMDNTIVKTDKEVFEKVMSNYLSMEKYAESLLDANRVCK
jgi:hypothetical protein